MTQTVQELYKYFRWDRLHSMVPASIAMGRAREVLSKGERYYKDNRPHGCGKRFEAYGEDHLRFMESPDCAGLRFVGYADELVKLRHTGWFTDSHGQDETVRGVVYQMTTRNGELRFVPGYGDPWNDVAACVSFDEIFTESYSDQMDCEDYKDSQAVRDCAYRADGIAEKMAESERDYQEAWQAGSEYAYKVEEIQSLREKVWSLLREIKAFRLVRNGDSMPAICNTLRTAIGGCLDDINTLREERDKLLKEWSGWRFDYGRKMESAFREGANLPQLEESN